MTAPLNILGEVEFTDPRARELLRMAYEAAANGTSTPNPICEKGVIVEGRDGSNVFTNERPATPDKWTLYYSSVITRTTFKMTLPKGIAQAVLYSPKFPEYLFT